MATTITGKLNKAANQFAAGESTGFGLRIGKQYYDRETKQKEWTNYECAVFARSDAQIQYYQSVLVEGAVVEVTAPEEKVRVFDGNNGPIYTIELINANVGYVYAPDQSGQQAPLQQHAPAQQQAPQQPSGNGIDFDEDLPF